jgi:hypothetical protein
MAGSRAIVFHEGYLIGILGVAQLVHTLTAINFVGTRVVYALQMAEVASSLAHILKGRTMLKQ